ncbi:unnamed protein product [Peniophora sp. CBMAI 1063]|nr:unnamed protein product [Peniophora sp. CBMAI 1063]
MSTQLSTATLTPLLPGPRITRGSLTTPPARGDHRGSTANNDHAGATGDQTPIGTVSQAMYYVIHLMVDSALFRDIAQRLENMSQSLSKQTAALGDQSEDVVEVQLAIDTDQLKSLHFLGLQLDNVEETIKIEKVELSHTFDKGFEDLGDALDKTFQATREQNDMLLRTIEEHRQRFSDKRRAVKAVKG